MSRPAREGLITALVAVAAWTVAGLVWLASGYLSLILVAAPIAWALVDAAVRHRKSRLARVVERAFPQLEAEAGGEGDFNGAAARVLARRVRLLGLLPPRLIELRWTQMPSGEQFVVRAELRSESHPVLWQVIRVSAEQAQQWMRDLA